jgi:hypothetical protein
VVDSEMKVKVGTCRDDGSGTVRGGREALTEGPGGLVTGRGG